MTITGFITEKFSPRLWKNNRQTTKILNNEVHEGHKKMRSKKLSKFRYRTNSISLP
jgi:hypothetical protein